MLTIPPIPKQFGPWNFKCSGPGSKIIKDIIEEVAKTVLVNEKIKKPDIYIELLLKNEEEMAKLNKQFMNKENACDTISIPFETIDPKNIKELNYIDSPILLGAIFLCWPIIKNDATNLKRDEYAHLAHIVVHSILHLLAYDHTEPTEQIRMEQKEIMILAKLGVQSPYL